MSNMALSQKTYENLANAIKLEVVDYLTEDDDYVDFLMEQIPRAIKYKFGQMDEDVLYELTMQLMTKITLKAL